MVNEKSEIENEMTEIATASGPQAMRASLPVSILNPSL